MRIAVLTSLYPSRVRPVEGVFAERRWTGMRSRGHAVRVIQPLPLASRFLPRARWRELARVPARESRAGIDVLRPRYLHLPGLARANARAFARAGLAALAREPRPEVVVLDYAWPAAAAAAPLHARGLPVLVSGRGSDVLAVAETPRLARALGAALCAAGHWCAVSADLVRAMDALAGAARGALVPNGVDTALFRPAPRAPARLALLQAAGLSETGRLVLVCGHWIARKDPLLALAAFARGAGPEDRLVFLGRGPLAQELHAAIRAAGLAARAELRPEVAPAELARWYAAADLVLLTSRREGRPNVLLEALASGRPVLATDAGGTAEVLGPLAATMLARTRDPALLGRQLAALLAAEHDPAALARSVAHLTWEASCAALEAALARAVAEPGEAR
jgi:glycosyltransferase involved in cell wall biosynthesis